MSTFSIKRAIKRIEEKQQQEEVEIIEEVEIVEETKEVEEVEELYICPICGKEYKTKRGLGKHLETKHKGGE